MKISNPSEGNVIATTDPLAIDIGDLAIPGALGEVSDSGHQHLVTDTDFWRLLAAQTAEATTSGTTEVDLVTLSSLSIPVTVPLVVVGSYRKTTGAAATLLLGLKLNATVVMTAVSSTRSLGFSANADAAISGGFYLYIAPRRALYLRALARFAGGDASVEDLALDVDTADMPAATITDVIIRGRTGSALVTLGVHDVKVYALPST